MFSINIYFANEGSDFGLATFDFISAAPPVSLAIFRRSLAARSNGRLRSNGWNREQHNKHSGAFQLTGKGVNHKAPPPTQCSERMGRGGLATGHKKRLKKLGGKGGKR